MIKSTITRKHLIVNNLRLMSSSPNFHKLNF